jgi:hypothetical protein
MVEDGEGVESVEEQSERIEHERSLPGCCDPSKVSSEFYDVFSEVRNRRQFFLQKTQGVDFCTRHRPVENSHRIDECLATGVGLCLCRDPREQGDLTRLCYPGSRHRKLLSMTATLPWIPWRVRTNHGQQDQHWQQDQPEPGNLVCSATPPRGGVD